MDVIRLAHNPIIAPRMKGLKGKRGNNINGPTLMKVPDWIESPLGKYYLYFGNHHGTYIRMAFSEKIQGPYTIYKPGTLDNSARFLKTKHIASPEISIDHDSKTIRMYFHAGIRGHGVLADQGQTSFVAFSQDGLTFQAEPTVLAPFYLRVFQYGGYYYGLVKNDNIDGQFVRSKHGITLFERGTRFIPGFRHCGLYRKEDVLYVFYTKIKTKPERIMMAKVDLKPDWEHWELSEPVEVLKPEKSWEGALLPLTQSKYGGTGAANALRDPFIYEENSRFYLFYAIKGEKGIAVAEIRDFL